MAYPPRTFFALLMHICASAKNPQKHKDPSHEKNPLRGGRFDRSFFGRVCASSDHQRYHQRF
jgi:hypothetical protein